MSDPRRPSIEELGGERRPYPHSPDSTAGTVRGLPPAGLLLVAVLVTGCGVEAGSGAAPAPSTTTYYCGSYASSSPGTVTTSRPC